MDEDSYKALSVVLNQNDSVVTALRKEVERLKRREPKNQYLRAVLSVIEAEKKAAKSEDNIATANQPRTCAIVDLEKIKKSYQAETHATDVEWSRIPLSAKCAIVPALNAFGYHVLTDYTGSMFVSWDTSQYGQDEMQGFCERAAVVYGGDAMPPPVLSLALL